MGVRVALLVLLFAVGLASLAQAKTKRMSKSMMDACYPVPPMEKLNSQPTRAMQIFTDFEFSCAGEIAAWNLYASKKGNFYAAVWRKHPDGRYEMIGKNYIEAKKTGQQTYFIPGHLRFRVNTGDLLGIHYHSKRGNSVVPYEDDTKRKVDKKVALSATISIANVYNDDLDLGHVLKAKQTMRKGKRAAALFPVMNKNRLRIDGGKNEMEGRAMFFSNGVWGSICDHRFTETGWPDVFCKELGYDHCQKATKARKMYTGVGKGAIGYQGPSCPLTGNLFMDECGKDKGTCGHDVDVFVECAYAVKLVGGKDSSEGRAMSVRRAGKKYKWGTICDKNPKAKEWASTLCHEIGFSHAALVKKAKKTSVGKGSGSIYMKNPTCRADKPYHLSYCAKNSGSCSHNDDIFVKCQHGVRVTGGKTAAEGLAEVFRHGKWGTVCLDTIQREMFPSVFCKDLGYERAETVMYAKKAYTKIGSGPINEMNPDCSPQDASNVLNCGHPKPTGCTHKKDIFIKCANNDLCKTKKPCQNGAICIDMENDYKCECAKGFTGANCEQDIDDCSPNPCKFGGKCIDKVNDYKCECGTKRHGDNCELYRMTKNHFTLRSFDEPTKNIYVETSHGKKDFSLSTASKAFWSVRSRYAGAVRLAVQGKSRYFVRARKNDLRLTSSKRSSEIDFYPKESEEHPGYFSFLSKRTKQYIVHNGDKMTVATGDKSNANFMKKALFSIHDLDAQNSIMMYNKRNFKGNRIGLTEDDDNLKNHGFNNKLTSFEIHGNSAWELFYGSNYNGRSIIAQPGRYDVDWVNSHFKNNKVSSVRKVLVQDGIVLWADKKFQGAKASISSSVRDLSKKSSIKSVKSIEVVGPSSWQLYTQAGFKGTKVVVAPGRFPAAWVEEHLKGENVLSAKKVEINTPMCSASSGTQKIVGKSGAEHKVFISHRQDGSVWMRFGEGSKKKAWTYKSNSNGALRANIISKKEISAMKDFSFIDWEVHTDVDMQVSVDNSWHPSKINVMYLGSKEQDTFKFKKTFSERTDISFAADKSQLACTGSVKGGKVLSNVCGEEGLPEYGTASSQLAITSVYLNPRAVNSYAKNRDFKRNAFTWSGSYYYVYAKLADCASSTGCYKKEKDVSYVLDKVLAKKDNRPETFYFGQMDQDVDACQAACKDEPECVAYTLYQDASKKLKGGCYGVGKSQVGKGVKMAGAFSGKALECGSFIPEYMEEDMWTRNTTGCPCKFDTSRTDCACCHEGACQCESRYKYQCTLCGFNDRCGSPFLTTSHGEYIFEYENQELSETGRHYKVPDLCVTGCEMDVRGAGSAASEVAAYMTDFAGDRVLSCVASDLDKAKKSAVRTDGATAVAEGTRISRINLYSFGGVGEMIQLRLKVNKKGCPVVKQDERYIGCFTMDAEDKDSAVHIPTLVSTHMSRAVCIKHCHNSRYNYAMLQSGTTCQCRNDLPTSGPAFTCDRFCSGDSRQVCGGMKAHSVYMTKFNAHTILVASGPSDCKSIGGVLAAVMPTAATGAECNKLTGAATSGDEVVECPMNMCTVSKIGGGGVFPARPGSCGNRKVAEILMRTKGADCLDMGGKPNYHQNDWGMCQIDTCTTNKPRKTIFSPVPPQSCPAYARVAEIEIKASPESCRTMGGAAQVRSEGEKEQNFCQFELCMQDKNPVKGNTYNFQHNNEEIEEGATHFFSLPKMCVTECQFGFKATAEGLSIAGVTLMGENKKEAGLFCGGEANNFTSESSLGFANMATGIIVTGLEITARNHSFILNELQLRTNPNGCKNDEQMIVLYNKPNFGGRPKVIKEDLGDLATINFNNKASSFKIYGDMQWEMFEHKDFKGRSIVLATGEYYDTSLLPFGNNDLSAVHRVGTLSANMEKTRQDISNARGVVCFKRTPKSSALFGLPPNTPTGENRPNVYFFGKFENDIDRCERACREEPQCSAFTLFSTVAEGSLVPWRGLCYGRSFRDDIQVYQEDVTSGYVSACAEEDTLTLYGEKEYAGVHSTIIENTVNVTFSAGPLSAMVTGKDTWRVLTESDGHIHTYNLSPGDYSDLSATFTGKVFQVSKMHPNTQLYKAQHNQVDLAPVAFNQIQKTITEIRTKVSSVNESKTVEVCNSTNEADVFFVIDSSSSIFAENYVKVLDFVAKVTESFSLGASKVRVGAIMYSWDPHYDIVLGQHTDSSTLEASIKDITYYRGGTYTHSALKSVREEGFTADVVRSGVSKQAIVITDGASRWPDQTTSEAHLCRDAGISMTAVGIKGANYDELHNIAGDASRVFNVSDFDQLGEIISAIEKTTCTAVNQGETVWNVTQHVSITVQGNDSNYFVHEDWEFNRKPVALGMESGVIYNSQIFASSALFGHEAQLGRLNHNSGWMTTTGNHTNEHEWIEIDLGKILPIHGIATQGHAIESSWVTKYKIAISLDGIHFVTFKDSNTSIDLIFLGNSDQSTIKYHCLHRLFGQAIQARVIRFIAVEWHLQISMRIELYGYRDADDSQLVETLRKDVWTRNVTGCPCYFDSSRKDCACCEDGGCQCPNTDRHQCVQCGYPHMCGTPNLRNPVNNIDGWTSSLSGCRCAFDPLRTDCACCQSYGCQCGGGNKNQCVNCGHPEHCGLKEHIFGPNPYCMPQTCPRKINTIWEGEAPHGLNPGEHNGVIKEVAASVVKAVMKAVGPA